ncbi:MAG: DUF7619 domain-containing protein, partial [Bacteroidia bacterium]
MKELYTNTQSIFSMKHIWKVLLLFIVFCSSQKAEGQFKEIGAFGNRDTIIPLVVNDTLFAAIYNRYNYNDGGYLKIVKYNGTSWQNLTSLKIKNSGVSSFNYYNNAFYLIGGFDTVLGIGNKINFLKWDRNQWSEPAKFPELLSWNKYYWTTNYYRAGPSNIFEGSLWIGAEGSFSWDDSDSLRIAAWDGNSWSLKDSTYKKIISAGVHSLDTLNGKIYVRGGFQFEDGLDTFIKTILVWDGNMWTSTNVPEHLFFTKYLDGYVYSKRSFNSYVDTIVYQVGNKKFDLTTGFNGWNISSSYSILLVPFNEKLFRFGGFNFNGDVREIAIWDGFKWTLFEPGVRNLRSISWGMNTVSTSNKSFLFTQKHILDSMFVFELTEVGVISGKVHYDKDADCVQDAGEPGIKNTLIKFSPGENYANTDAEGNYSFIASTGTYQASLVPAKYWKQTCPANAITVTAKKDEEVTGIDFASTPIPNVKDVRVALTGATGWRARQGFFENYTLCYKNEGTTTASGTIKLQYGTKFSGFTSVPQPTNYTPDTAEWAFQDLKMGEEACIKISLRVEVIGLGDTVKLIAYFDGGDNWIDSTLADNYDALKQRVVAALDPNDKTAYPEGDIKEGTKELRYQIRFQNTGTDTAYRVTIIDTIDTNLPLTKVMMNAASHKYELDIKNNVFKWTFEGIMLPDSNINEPLSHGFINYTAQIKPSVAIGTEIKNTAYIYFDYQKPVITNTARNKMVVGIREEKAQSISNELHIYPNPASAFIYIKNEGKQDKELQLVNILGQVLKTIK